MLELIDQVLEYRRKGKSFFELLNDRKAERQQKIVTKMLGTSDKFKRRF